MTKSSRGSGSACRVLVKRQHCSESRLSSVLFHSISSLIETNPCPPFFPPASLRLCLFHVLYIHCTSRQIPPVWPRITFTNLHISPVYFNTLCAGPPQIPFHPVLLTVLLNSGGGGHVAGGSVQGLRGGVQCELTFLGVRIVQEQQAHSSSGRSERSSLMMISIIQAICANRRRVFIRLLESARLAAPPALPPVLFDYHLRCCPPLPTNAPQRWPLFRVRVGLRRQFPCAGVSQRRCAISVSLTASFLSYCACPGFHFVAQMFRLFGGKTRNRFIIHRDLWWEDLSTISDSSCMRSTNAWLLCLFLLFLL